ncbi:S-adenosyl-L-methionine-dependent methyltransferase [Calycina marina]|uniref:S-adenosyl-L-methionine-dependent methyltransferase n=1 Tax=Calycina marina TaxID=1763456 RepID=A0A9P7YYY1_9HELO|nr:S-adenosyl-L-methionine-dependent methyltransferase [Calycina marina]
MKLIKIFPVLGRHVVRQSSRQSRDYAVASSAGNPSLQVFNRHSKYMQKERAASNVERSRQVDYLKDEVALRLSERLLDINRHFNHVLDLGANSCNITRALTLPDPNSNPDLVEKDPVPIGSRISQVTAADSSKTMLYRDEYLPFNQEINLTRDVLQDEELLPYEKETFDAVLSSLSMHWINDLPSLLAQINNVLKPDAPFLAAMFGGDTLFELRTSLQLADTERRGGVSPHVSPLADVKDVGGLLQKAGFKMLTVDIDDIIVDFPDTFALMQDLQAMGESNAILGREAGAIKRDVLLANEGIYRELHGNPDGTIPATFRLIYMIGWKEGPNQSEPLARGSGQTNISDILGGGGTIG